MAKENLLKIVRSVLSSIDGDDVSNIGETPDSEQVLEVVKDVYFDWMYDGDWEHLNKLTELEAVSDVNRPNFFKIPKDCYDIQWIKYDVTESSDTKTKIKTLIRLDPEDFIDRLYMRNTSDSNVITVNTETLDGIPLFIVDDQNPTYWTSFDDEYIVFDSYNKDEDTTVQASKSISYAKKVIPWENKNEFIPDLPENLFPAFKARIKEKCWFYFKQADNPLDRQEAHRGKSRFRRSGTKTAYRHKRPNYGRN